MARRGFYVVLTKKEDKGLVSRESRYGHSISLTKIDPTDAFHYLELNTYSGEYGLEAAKHDLRRYVSSKKTVSSDDLKIVYVSLYAEVMDKEEYTGDGDE